MSVDYDARRREEKSTCPYLPRPDGGITCRIAVAAADPAGPELSPIRRRARLAGHSERLERHLESSLHRGRRRGACAMSRRRRNHRHLRWNLPDRLRLVLLSLVTERRHLVLGPAADGACLHGNPRQRGRGARERRSGGHSAVAAACNRRAQPVAVALERRFAALWLGAIFSLPGIAADVPAASAEIYRHVLLDHCRGALCACQGIRAVRPCDLFGREYCKRAYAQAPGGSCRLLR